MTTEQAKQTLERHAEGFTADDLVYVYRIAKAKAQPAYRAPDVAALTEIETAAQVLGITR